MANAHNLIHGKNVPFNSRKTWVIIYDVDVARKKL